MRLPAAYLGIIVIWSTTPLAIQWSGEAVGPLFGVTARMVLGAAISLALILLLRIPMPWTRSALVAYASAAVGIYGGMLGAYWAAQQVPSGLIAVMFGLTPLLVGVIDTAIPGERGLTASRLLGIVLGLAGLGVIFQGNLTDHPAATLGVLVLLGAVTLHSLSMVLVKHTGAGIPALAQSTGGLLVALPLYLLTWAILDGGVPQETPLRSALAIGYLALFGSVLGFMLYFFALRRLSTATMALIPMLTPVTALLLGQTVNGETVPAAVWAGTALILLGLALHQSGSLRLRRAARDGRLSVFGPGDEPCSDTEREPVKRK